jgi:peptidoglycan/xylan/chitin deacetylase (PgdA/CDA1 family)
VTRLYPPGPNSPADSSLARIGRSVREGSGRLLRDDSGRWLRGRGAIAAAIAGLVAAGLVVAIAATTPSRSPQAKIASGAGATATGSPSASPGDDGGPSPSPTPVQRPGGPPRLPGFGAVPMAAPVDPGNGPSAAWFSAIPTTQKVAFITIDDGFVKDPQFVQVLRDSHVRVTLFLEINAIADNPDYFRLLEAAGAVIEAHTISHPELAGTSYDFQRHEICDGADKLATWYGRRPQLFRPPYGDKDATTLRVVHDCGMKAAFFWRETINAGIVRYQIGNKVQPGDIMLMHFRPTVVQDFIAGLQAIKDAGLTPALLEDYVGGSPPAPPPSAPIPTISPLPPASTPTPTPVPTDSTPPEG